MLTKAFKRCKRCKAGFTLVEIMMAAGVLAILMYFIYQIFTSFARTQEMGHWTSATTKQLRNGLTLLRNEIGRATRPEVVTQKGSEAFVTGNGDREQFMYVPDTLPFASENVTADQKILQFYMCRPGKSSLPGTSDIAPEIITGTLFTQNGQLKYQRIIESQPADFPDKIPELSQVIAEDISKIEISSREIAPTGELSVSNRNFLLITLTARHRRYQNSAVTESIEVPFEVPVKRGGFP